VQCHQCKSHWPDEFKFCPECGIPIVVAQASERGALVEGDENVTVTGDVGHDLTVSVVQNYLDGSPKLGKEAFRRALDRYLTWLDESCGWLTLRGIKQRDQQVLTLPLDEVYTSLTVETRSTGPTVDVGQLLLQGSRLVVTGAPGSGKSTVLQYVTWTLARALRTGDAQLAAGRLGFTIPRDREGNLQPEQLKLLLPIFIPLHAYAEHLRRFGAGDDARKATLAAFVSAYLIRRQAGLGLPDDFFEQLLVRGQSCLLLLDGLDEVPDEKTRVRVSRAVEDLVNAAPRNQVVVTCRPVAYGGEAVLGARFRPLHLQPMSEEQVARLVTRFYQAAIVDEQERARETTALLRAVDNLEKLRARLGAAERFITTPLLVRMIVIVHFSRRQLPEQRAELYREVVDVLLAASYHPDVNVAQALAEAGGAMSQRRNLLGVLAFHMHSRGQGARTIREADLKRVLLDYLAPQAGPEQAARMVDAFVTTTRERGSFLDERSGQYQFLHQSFQEFLAARHLAETVREVDEMAVFLEDGRLDDAWWREPALLLLGYLSNSSPEVAARLARRLARLPAPGAPDPGWPPLAAADRLAGAALAAAGILEQPDAPPALRRELADLLTELLTAGRGPQEWAATGDALARLGDPRPGGGLRPDGLPDIVWCEVAAGPFPMGSDPKDGFHAMGREQPQHKVYLPTFYIARYPVTVVQFRAFVQDSGFRLRDKRCLQGVENHPVVWVDWHDARAFCAWLTERLWAGGVTPEPLATFFRAGLDYHPETVEGGDQPWVVRLPTEAEWEKAARGTDGRIWPWGNECEAGNYNTYESGIGNTSAVGLFPGGTSPYGALDMAGNVWEWCQSLHKPYPYQSGDGREDLAAEGHRVLRGGSWDYSERVTRCAFRNLSHPEDRNVNRGFRLCVAPRLE
jgi:formylglycine-generating enzyme required for sulfatase activity